MRKILSFIMVLLVVSTVNMRVDAAGDIPEPTAQFYINDYANIFSDEEEAYIFETSNEIAEAYDGVQVVVSTITTTNGTNIDTYATNMYNAYGIGKDSKGILILIATEDRDVVVRVGDNFKSVISNKTAESIVTNYGIPKLKVNDFSGGIMAMYDRTCDIIDAFYEAPAAAENAPVANVVSNVETEPTLWPDSAKTWIIVLVLFWAISVIYLIYRYTMNIKAITKEEAELINRKDAKIEELKTMYNSVISSNSYLDTSLKKANTKIEMLENDLRIAKEIYSSTSMSGSLDDRIYAFKVTEEIDKASQKVEYLFDELRSINMNDLEGFIKTKEAFDEVYRDYINQYDPMMIDVPENRAIVEGLLRKVTRSAVEDLNYKERKVREEIEARQRARDEEEAREIERLLENAKSRRSKSACRDAIHQYERRMNDRILLFMTAHYIHMYDDMKRAVKNPYQSNSFFPAEHRPSSSSSSSHNSYGHSSLFGVGGFGGHSGGGGFSSKF